METTSHPPHGAGREEWAAAAILTLATLFFWWRGFRAFTIAGAILFITALVQLGLHRRRVAVGRPRSPSPAKITTSFAALLFPGLIALRWFGIVPSVVAFASADFLFGGLLYALGLMELVELATLRALNDR